MELRTYHKSLTALIYFSTNSWRSLFYVDRTAVIPSPLNDAEFFSWREPLFLNPNSFRLSYIKTGSPVFLSSCKRLKPSHNHQLQWSQQQNPTCFDVRGKEEFNPTFESKRNQVLLCKFLHGRACLAALPKPATAPFKEGLGFELFGRKIRKPKEVYLKYSVLKCVEHLTIWKHGRNTKLISFGSKQAWLGFCC